MTYFTRADWGARPATPGPGPLTASRVEGVALHWPAMVHPLVDVAAVKAGLRGWQAYHMDEHGWSDIAYQEAIDQDGNTYECRGLRIQSAANGDEDVNQRFGALLLVLSPGEQPSPAMTRTVQQRVHVHRTFFPGSRRIVGHQQIRPDPTECPGKAVMSGITSGRFNPPDPHRAARRRTRHELSGALVQRRTLTARIKRLRARLAGLVSGG